MTTPPPTTAFAPDPNATQVANGTWQLVENGISITLTINPAAPHVGESVHFVMTASSPKSGCCFTAFYPGDGALVGPTIGPLDCITSQPSTFTQEVDHVYSRPGSLVVEVQPSILGLCHGVPSGVINAAMFVPFTVLPASSPTH